MRFIGNSFMRTFARIPQALRLPVKVGGWLGGSYKVYIGSTTPWRAAGVSHKKWAAAVALDSI